MSDPDFQLLCLRDPRLADCATGSAPAWLWTADGQNVLWANPAAVRIFGANNARELSGRVMGAADQHRRQVAQLAQRLPADGATRLERLRGFGSALGMLTTCACSRVEAPGGTQAVLVIANEPGGRFMPIETRLAMVIDALDDTAAAFTINGSFIAANHAAQALDGFAATRPHFDIGRIAPHLFDRERHARGTEVVTTDLGPLSLDRVGTGNDAGWIGIFSEDIQPSAEPVAVASSDTPVAALTGLTGAMLPDMSEATKESAVSETVAATPLTDTRPPNARQYPLRFLWQMDRDGRFSLGSDEFQRLIGTHTGFAVGRLWSDLAAALGLDPEGRVAQAIATQNTWGNITVQWPVDGSETRLPIELSGLPVYDRARNFIGYRGFGVCCDLEGLTRLAAEREDDALFGASPETSSKTTSGPAVAATAATLSSHNHQHHTDLSAASTSETAMADTTHEPNEAHEPPRQTDAAPNVVPFPFAGDTRPPTLSVKETNTFNEIARQLTARLEGDAGEATVVSGVATPAIETTAATPTTAAGNDVFPAWLSNGAAVTQANSAQDIQLLDRLPVGVLIYRLDRMIYANNVFLDHAGYRNLHAFNEAGGLDTLYIEPGATGDSTSDKGVPLVIAGSKGHGQTDARLYSIVWDGEPAMALIYGPPHQTAAVTAPTPAAVPVPVPPIRGTHHDLAEELSAILDTTAEGVLMFDGLGRVSSCNRSAEALFGRDGAQIIQGNLIDLFTPESQRIVLNYLQSVKSTGVASLLDHGREVTGRARDGGSIPLAVTMGRTRPDGARYFAVFRDLSQIRKRETELLNARKSADRMASAKSDMLGKLSHEVRAPLSAIVGFADVMIQERFGPLGNDRYVEYMKDIRASGERVTTIIDDLLDLSSVESGKLDLSLTSQNLNTMVEQCVAVMQPQANRERIIIRTSLAHALPSVKADVRALRQIALNLIGNSIHAAHAGGQVIVSTAMTDFGDVVLRIRDSGQGLNDNEVAAAMAPFRTQTASGSPGSDTGGASLSLAKALVEANHAQFNIKTAPNAGTLIEVVFSHASAIA